MDNYKKEIDKYITNIYLFLDGHLSGGYGASPAIHINKLKTLDLLSFNVNDDSAARTSRPTRILFYVSELAIKNAYKVVEKIKWDGIHYRKDIGKKTK